MWFYINSLYFPYDAQFTAQQTFEEFFAPLRSAMSKVQVVAEPKNEDQTGEKGVPEEVIQLPELIECLQEQPKFNKFKDLINELLSQ